MFVVWFYSWSWLLVFIISGRTDLCVTKNIRYLLPLMHSGYWFITSYLGLYLLSPILKITISNMTQRQHFFAIALLLILFSIWPDLMPRLNPMGVTEKGFSVVWFVVLYFTAAYIRKYDILPQWKRRMFLTSYIGLSLTILLSWIVVSFVTNIRDYSGEWIDSLQFHWYRYNSLLCFLASLSIFLLFRKLDLKSERVQLLLKKLTPLVLGVYLIHDNELAREFIWSGLKEYAGQLYLIPLYSFTYILGLFIVCLLIDYLRFEMFSYINGKVCYKRLLLKVDSMPDAILNRIKV